jgi:photosystem II stability/assembly factor-like uncharacterized protein
MIKNLLFAIVLLGLLSCEQGETPNANPESSPNSEKEVSVHIDILASNITDTLEHFRGLDISGDVAIIGGSLGNVYKYQLKAGSLTLLGAHPGRHLRDIDILDNGNILALAITEPAEILLKDASSDTFEVVFHDPDTLAFLDGIDFWGNAIGLAFGDPNGGYPYFLITYDGGQTWNRFPKESFPEELNDYAGFAASGTSLKCLTSGPAIIGLGNETGKVLRMNDLGKTWSLIDVPYHQEPQGSGIYSLCFKDDLNGVAVGGHWQNVTCDSSKLYTTDGGSTWHLGSGIQEYRSCVTYFKDNIYLSTGTTGTDISYDGGMSWELLDTIGYNAIAFTEEGIGVGVSNFGIVNLLELKGIK